MKTENVKGFVDIEDSSKRNNIKQIIQDVFELYNFQAVETPLIEYEEFVKGDNAQDEAVSDIFKLKDKGERKLALRYEFTFQLKRLAKNKKLPYKRFQIGQVFRDEPVTGNRWRQFTQCDADIVGSKMEDEAEILKLIAEILNKLKIKFTINFNNRKLLNEILDGFEIKEKEKEKVIREIDKLDKLSEKEVKENLKKYNAEKVLNLFKKDEKFFEKYGAYQEIKNLKKFCKLLGVKLNFSPFLARGLSYYNGTVFEVSGEMKETIAAGGSYVINGNQSCGVSFGLERLEMLAKVEDSNKKVLVLSLGQNKVAVGLADKIRKTGIPCSVYYGKPGKALDYANSYGFPWVVFVGDEEVKKKKFKLKNMVNGSERFVGAGELVEVLR